MKRFTPRHLACSLALSALAFTSCAAPRCGSKALDAGSVLIYSEARAAGQPRPSEDRWQANGDFLILANRDQQSGTGFNEQVAWTTCFSADELNEVHRPDSLLRKATLILDGQYAGGSEQALFILGVAEFPLTAQLKDRPIGAQARFRFNLVQLKGLSLADLRRQLLSTGQLTFRIGDEFLVRTARLELEFGPAS